MDAVTVNDLKDHTGELLGRVQLGYERVAITRYGEQVAAIVPIEDARLLERLQEMIEAEGAFKAIEEAEWESATGVVELRKRLWRPA